MVDELIIQILPCIKHVSLPIAGFKESSRLPKVCKEYVIAVIQPAKDHTIIENIINRFNCLWGSNGAFIDV